MDFGQNCAFKIVHFWFWALFCFLNFWDWLSCWWFDPFKKTNNSKKKMLFLWKRSASLKWHLSKKCFIQANNLCQKFSSEFSPFCWISTKNCWILACVFIGNWCKSDFSTVKFRGRTGAFGIKGLKIWQILTEIVKRSESFS